MKFRYQPVVWLTTLAVLVGGLLQLDSELDILPDDWVSWLVKAAGVIAVLITAVKTWGSVTPLARPRDSAEVPLVPVASRR